MRSLLMEAGRTISADEIRSSRSSKYRRELIQTLDRLIWEDRKITLLKVSTIVDISYGPAQAIGHDALGYSNVSTHWVPKQAIDEDVVL